MFIFNRKRIIFLISCCLISFFAIYIADTNLIKNPTIMTSGTPVSGHTIILDAGHGKPDGGATNDHGVSEEEINLKIVLKLQDLLEQSGSNVLLTRSDENGIYDLDANSKKTSDLKNRVELANSEDADIFVSIHLNKIPQNKYYGWQTFYQKNNEKSEELASSIQNNLNYSIQKENKREILELSGKYIMDNVKIPTVTVECGFLSNEEEAKQLQDNNYQDALAWGIYTGIMDYFYN